MTLPVSSRNITFDVDYGLFDPTLVLDTGMVQNVPPDAAVMTPPPHKHRWLPNLWLG